MQVTTEQIHPSQIALTISVEPDKVKEAQEKAFRHFAKDIQLPGFRRGKVPPQMARAYIDPDRIRQRAAESLVGPAYEEALQQTQVVPFGGLNPEFELVEMKEDGPLIFKAIVPLPPAVTLGPYKGLAVERRRLQVTDADVEQQLENILSRQAEYPEIKDRPVQTGDVVLGQVQTVIEGDTQPPSEPRAVVIEVGKNVPDFDANLVGMEIGETKTFDVTYAEDYADADLRGKKVTFTFTVNELRGKIMPEFNEEFVRKIHPTAKTPEEFRAEIRNSLERAAESMADNDVESQILTAIVDNSQIHFPDSLLTAELQSDIRQLQEQAKQENVTIEQLLQQQGRTVQQAELEMRYAADRRIRNSLVLAEIARAESLSVTEEEVDQAIQEEAERARVSAAALRAYAEKNEQMNRFRDQALLRKIMAFLRESAVITPRLVTAEDLRTMQEGSERSAQNAGASPTESAPLAVTAGRTIRRSKRPDTVTAEENAGESVAKDKEATDNA